ncbi:MAG: hypothetical protein E7587_09520 [Ruminococcaceae bacterium]|nr:hypothetical protein [Oscillospiraceae bacterium]
MQNKIFAQDARVAMIGDSITHNGIAVAYIQEYYRTHFPSRNVKIFNLGIGGDNASNAYNRLDEILSVEPTEAVVMFGVNDMGVQNYRDNPTDDNLSAREQSRQRHLDGTVRLVKALIEKNIPVTLCSSVGRDEYTKSDKGLKTFGATKALYEMFEDNVKALSGMLKNTVDYLTPMQELGASLEEAGLPSLFCEDRTHPNVLGQNMMARILLRAQGLPVELPTLEDFKNGWQERKLPDDIKKRHAIETKWRDLHWVYPHQRDRTGNVPLEERIAFWKEELKKDLEQYFVNMYTNYVENAHMDDEYFKEYLALTDALYTK